MRQASAMTGQRHLRSDERQTMNATENDETVWTDGKEYVSGCTTSVWSSGMERNGRGRMTACLMKISASPH